MNCLIKILPRIAVERMISKEVEVSMPTPFALISIHSDLKGRSGPVKGLGSLTDKNISLMFGDYGFHEDLDGHMTEDQAKELVSFIDDNKECSFIVHCDAGVSRSGAVGTFICRYLRHSLESFKIVNPNILPNDYVLDMLQEVSGLRGEYQDFWENLPTDPGDSIWD